LYWVQSAVASLPPPSTASGCNCVCMFAAAAACLP
jgi:hypothetical protein